MPPATARPAPFTQAARFTQAIVFDRPALLAALRDLAPFFRPAPDDEPTAPSRILLTTVGSTVRWSVLGADGLLATTWRSTLTSGASAWPTPLAFPFMGFLNAVDLLSADSLHLGIQPDGVIALSIDDTADTTPVALSNLLAARFAAAELIGRRPNQAANPIAALDLPVAALARAIACVEPFTADRQSTPPWTEGVLFRLARSEGDRQTLNLTATDGHVVATSSLTDPSTSREPTHDGANRLPYILAAPRHLVAIAETLSACQPDTVARLSFGSHVLIIDTPTLHFELPSLPHSAAACDALLPVSSVYEITVDRITLAGALYDGMSNPAAEDVDPNLPVIPTELAVDIDPVTGRAVLTVTAGDMATTIPLAVQPVSGDASPAPPPGTTLYVDPHLLLEILALAIGPTVVLAWSPYFDQDHLMDTLVSITDPGDPAPKWHLAPCLPPSAGTLP
jgi:hypothetical protein